MQGSPVISQQEGRDARTAPCCDHEHSTDPSQDGGGWVRALAVATFDVGTGHTLEQVYPPDCLDDGDRQRIRMLAMPDCNTTQIGDCFYCFRTRKSHGLPLLSSALLDQHFEYCYAYFRQERNEECARGMFQKSVVLVSRYPYVNLFERLVKVFGPLYFSHGPAVLEAVFSSVEEWPAPCPGSLCPLPFLGETIMFQVPEIDMPPQVASKYRYHRGVHLCASWPRSRVKSLTRTLSGCGSVDLPYGSPMSRRASGSSFTSPSGAPDQAHAPEVKRRSIDGSDLTLKAAGTMAEGAAAADDETDLNESSGSASGTAGPARHRPVHEGASDQHASQMNGTPSENKEEAWGKRMATGTPSGGGAGGRGDSVFWSGTARSPGVLVSPGLRLSTDGVDGGHGRGRSSLGSGSMASVVCDSPSESWLTTPRSGNNFLGLDGSGGSNLAQSCYYVADRESDEDDEDEEGPRGELGLRLEEGWQHGEDWKSGGGSVEPGSAHDGGDGIATARSSEEQPGDSQAAEGGHRAAALHATRSATATAAAAPLEENLPKPPILSSNPASSGAGARARLASPAAPSEMQRSSTAPAAPEATATNAAAAVAAAQESRDVTGTSSAASRPLVKRKIAAGRDRATSFSPPRSSVRAHPSNKPSQTPNPKSGGRWSGLRAWADAGPDDPWDAPPPLATDFGLAGSTSLHGTGSRLSTASIRGSVGSTAADDPRRGRDTSRGESRPSDRTGSESVVEEAKGAAVVAPNGRTVEEEGTGVSSSVGGVSRADTPLQGVVAPVVRSVTARGQEQGGRQDAAVTVAVAGRASGNPVGSSRCDGDGDGDGDVSRGSSDVGGRRRASAGGSLESVKGASDRRDAGRLPGARVSGGARGVPAAVSAGDGRSGAGTGVQVGAGSPGTVLVVGSKGSKGGAEREAGEEDNESAAGNKPLTRKASYRLVQDGRAGRLPSFSKSNSIHRSARHIHGGRSPFAEMLLADEARFRAKQGLFQSIGLYSIFGKKLVEHLWLLWELVLTASPTLVVGSSVGASSAAILGMVSLASPVYFGGDFRPHFTTFDPDYREIVAAHDNVSKQQMWGSSVLGVPSAGSGADSAGGFPSILLGVINPIFLRTLSRWPNAIVLPGAAGRSSNSRGAVYHKLQKELSEDGGVGSPRNRNCPTPVTDGLAAARPPPVRVQVVRTGASLEQMVAQDDRPSQPIIVARQQPVMVPDVAVLSRLLDPASPYNPATAAAAAAVAASTPVHGHPPTPIAGVVAAAAAAAEEAAGGKGGSETRGQWKDSLRAINDIILRRHFADLTRSFLGPFDKFFRRSRPTQSLTAWQHLALSRLSVYTDAEALLPRFDEEEFLTELFVAGPPKCFAHVQWETLYRRFMDSPNFRPWFTTQRLEGVERIREMNRVVCLRTTPQAIVEACAPTRRQQLLEKIKASIAREWKQKGQRVDWELLERMELHQKAVEAAVAARVSGGRPALTATGSVQP